jgi:hypothetical protein
MTRARGGDPACGRLTACETDTNMWSQWRDQQNLR